MRPDSPSGHSRMEVVEGRGERSRKSESVFASARGVDRSRDTGAGVLAILERIPYRNEEVTRMTQRFFNIEGFAHPLICWVLP
jgi:hypothetical protein